MIIKMLYLIMVIVGILIIGLIMFSKKKIEDKVLLSILVGIGLICIVVLLKVETMTPNSKYIQSKRILELETEELK